MSPPNEKGGPDEAADPETITDRLTDDQQEITRWIYDTVRWSDRKRSGRGWLREYSRAGVA